MSSWIVGFFIGCLAGKSLPFLSSIDLYPFIFTSAILALTLTIFFILPWFGFLSNRRQILGKAQSILILISAFGWGAYYNPSAAGLSFAESRITETAASCYPVTNQPIIIQHENQRSLAMGCGSIGDLGTTVVSGQARLFSRQNVSFTTGSFSTSTSGSITEQLVNATKKYLINKIGAYDKRLQNWLLSLILGLSSNSLDKKLKRAFKQTGTFHLLSISGLHISLMAMVVLNALRWPLQLAYGFRLLRPRGWIRASALINILSSLMILFYGQLVVFSQATQRAVLVFMVMQLGLIFIGILPLRKRLFITLGLQTIFFPIDFLSESTLMSWGAYLILLEILLRTKDKNPLYRLLVVQFKLFIFSAACFGQLCVFGLALNLLVIPIFSVVYISACMLILLDNSTTWLTTVIIGINEKFQEIILHAGTMVQLHPWLSWNLQGDLNLLRLFLLFVSGFLLLNSCKKLSIHDGETTYF